MLFFYRVENWIPIALSVLRAITQRFHLNIITPFRMILINNLYLYLREYLGESTKMTTTSLIREYLPDKNIRFNRLRNLQSIKRNIIFGIFRVEM